MAESRPAHQADDGQIDIEFTEEPQDVVLDTQEANTGEIHQQEVDVDSSEDEHEQYGKSVQKRINQLTKRAREAEREREEAVRYAQVVQQEAVSVKQRLHNLDKSYIDEYGNRVSSEQQRAKDEYKTAIETGDTDRQLAAQEKMQQLAVAADRHAQARAQREAQAAQVQAEMQQPVYQPAPTTQKPDPKAENWAEANPWFGEDSAMTFAAFGIHKELVLEKGMDGTSDEYYDALDSRIRDSFPHKFVDEETQNTRRTSQTVAGVSRPSRGGRGKKVRLSPSQVTIAKRLGVPLEEYAKYVKE
jgi:hypothetical protein